MPSQSGCKYTYLTQPPQKEISCNIYANNNLQLDCSAASVERANFTVKWYFNGQQFINPIIGSAMFETRQQGQPTVYFHLSRLFLSHSDIMPGQYYCQVESSAENSSTDVEFVPSNILSLGEKELLKDASPCNNTLFSVDETKCAHTLDHFANNETTDTVGNLFTNTTSNQFPIWGYIAAPLGFTFITVAVVLFVSVFVYNVKYHLSSQKREKQSVTVVNGEDRSERDSTSTDHTYEELDTCLSEMERRQQHFPADFKSPGMEHIQQNSNIGELETESSEMEHRQPSSNISDLENQDYELESWQQHFVTNNMEEAEQPEMEYSQKYLPGNKMDYKRSNLSQVATETELRSCADSYDKLLPNVLSSDVAWTNEAHYDQLDPRVKDNTSYKMRSIHDPHMMTNPSYIHQAELELSTAVNRAYNKRDELDPQTDVCLAYNYNVVSL